MVDKIIKDKFRIFLPYDVCHRNGSGPLCKVLSGSDNELMRLIPHCKKGHGVTIG